jgi:hypothetical protein
MKRMSFQESCPDLEEMAAFVDGKLTGEERTEMVRHLDSCATCYEVFVEASKFRAESERAGTLADFPSPPPRGRGSLFPGRLGWAAAAALLAVVAFRGPVTDLLSGRGLLTAELRVQRLAGHVGPSNDAFRPGWSYSRGGANGVYALGLSPSVRSVRLGVRLVDLEVALRAGDSNAAVLLLPEVEDLVGSFERAELLEIGYYELERQLGAGVPAESLRDDSASLAALTAHVALSEYFALGKWAEASRLAAGAGTTRFFRRRAVREFPARIAGLELSPEASAAFDGVAQRLEREVAASNLPDLAAAFSVLVKEAGG